MSSETTVEHRPEPVDRGVVIGRGLTALARWSWRLVLLAAGAVVVWWVLGKLWVGVFPVLLALIVATVLWPPTRWLRAKGVPSALAAALVIVGSLLVFFGVLGAIAPSLVSQSGDLADQAAKGLGDLQELAAKPPFNVDSATIDDAVGKATTWLQERSGQIASGALAGASAVGSGLVTLVLVLVLVFFFIKDGPAFLPFVRRVAGERAGGHLTEVATRSWNTLGGFIRTQALVSAVDAVLIGTGLALLGVPLAFALAILTFFGGFVPIVGAFAVGVLSVLVALVAQGPTTALLVLALIIAVQQIEGNVLQPFLQGRSMQLHAGVILLAVAVGSTLFGIVGAFLAVPVAAVAAVVLRYISEQVDLRAGIVSADEVVTESAEGGEVADEVEDEAPVRS
ncbi:MULTISPECIES: AI-2E family transporter [Janibacter]|uniref:AI-2E family transporter n=1 Tax=Janibacter TaxID=53457 RepID=UPI000838C0B4|nr:AI-2E family transporter [Janibacter terrae]MBA4083733.1 AI-2E family transporter [Kytococcus sp.]